MKNEYVAAIHRTLPRLIASFNADTTSDLFGVGDRYHWGWKLIDFPNGTFQGAVHGLAILLHSKLLPANITEAEILSVIRNAITGLKLITTKNGSLDEALPNEGSYCVTALVASDALAAKQLLKEILTSSEQQEWLDTIQPMITFLKRQDEHHAVISNHLASGALAMFRWHDASGDKEAENRGKFWLDRILEQQSPEGWFSEYGGADPGYQSWCTTQLAQLHILRPDLDLLPCLSRSLAFLSYAAHPDGSFGGSYGSRNTRFIMPGGIEMRRDLDENAEAISNFSRQSIGDFRCVALDTMDAGNLVPFFNDYALAAKASAETEEATTPAALPCRSSPFRKWFPDAGWLVDCGPDYYTIVNINRGGASVHFIGDKRQIDDCGVVAIDNKERIYSSFQSQPIQLTDRITGENSISLQYSLLPVKRPLPGPLNFIILRLMSITVFNFLQLGNLVKKLLVYLLISRKPKAVGLVTRNFKLGREFEINDSIKCTMDLQQLKETRHFSAIHMASQGYWQRNDGELTDRNE